MSFEYSISPRAKLEALDIAVWYQKQAELGYTFLSEPTAVPLTKIRHAGAGRYPVNR